MRLLCRTLRGKKRREWGGRENCQRLLTAGIEGWGGVLKGGEGLVLPEALGQVLGGLRVELAAAEAANRAESGVS